jgi:hypothetical protein
MAGKAKPQKRQSPDKSGLCRIKMAEAMGFELMDLLQSTVFKSEAQMPVIQGL